MPVFVRTAAGNAAALNPNSPLPRKLRTLLISIDGRTRLGTYVNSLSSFGDVEALIESLLQAGLIQPLVTQPADGDANAEKPAGSAFSRQATASWSNTDVGNTNWQGPRGGAVTQPPVDDLLSWSKFQQPPAAPAPSFRPPSASPKTATTAVYQLRNAISLMSDFVTHHLPMESLELVLMLEGLQSVEQVGASLQGYEAMVKHVGEPARKHMAELRTVLSSF